MRAKVGPGWAQRGLCAIVVGVAGCAAPGGARAYDGRHDEYLRTQPPPDGNPSGDLSLGAPLERAALVRAVLARNPTIEAARQAWRAALEEVPQATALDDPMLSYAVAPFSIASDVRLGHEVQLSQRLPFPGKRRLAGEVAVAEAEAARSEAATVRLELALMASNLFDDYYVAARALTINAEHQALLAHLKQSAEAQYVAGRAAQQDPLQAEVELAHLEHERLVLETELAVLRAQANALLHRVVTAPLPPPPADLPATSKAVAPLATLLDVALEKRPELEADRARLRAGDAAVDLAARERYPDLEIMGSYSSMWDMPEHQWMVGLGLNLPIWRGKRKAAERSAQAQTGRLTSQLEGRVDEIRVEVERSRRQLEEAMHVVHLYESRLVPAARDQVAAAMAGFPTGTTPFLAVIEAEKNQRVVKLRYETARADVHRRRAALDRATGRLPGAADGGAR